MYLIASPIDAILSASLSPTQIYTHRGGRGEGREGKKGTAAAGAAGAAGAAAGTVPGGGP